MKRFHYSLQPVLTLRQRAEQSALERYAAALVARQRALDRLAEVSRAQSESWLFWRDQIKNGHSAGELRQWQGSFRTLADQRLRAETELGTSELNAHQALQEVLLARRDREAVEKHLHKRRLQHQSELNRHEQLVLDELAQRHRSPWLHADKIPETVV